MLVVDFSRIATCSSWLNHFKLLTKRYVNNWYPLSSVFSEVAFVALALGFFFSGHEELEQIVCAIVVLCDTFWGGITLP